MATNAPRQYKGEKKPEAPPPPPPKKVCGGEGCSFYPPVNGVHTCKYCGRRVPVYNEWALREKVVISESVTVIKKVQLKEKL